MIKKHIKILFINKKKNFKNTNTTIFSDTHYPFGNWNSRPLLEPWSFSLQPSFFPSTIILYNIFSYEVKSNIYRKYQNYHY